MAPANNGQRLWKHVLPLILVVHVHTGYQTKVRKANLLILTYGFNTWKGTHRTPGECGSIQGKLYFLDHARPTHLQAPPLYRSRTFQSA